MFLDLIEKANRRQRENEIREQYEKRERAERFSLSDLLESFAVVKITTISQNVYTFKRETPTTCTITDARSGANETGEITVLLKGVSAKIGEPLMMKNFRKTITTNVKSIAGYINDPDKSKHHS